MTIALLLIAALALMAFMLVLTVLVNDLEKKSLELAGLIKKRYTLKSIPKKDRAAEKAVPPAGGGINIPPPGKPPGKP
jgi:hypothetical protein